MDDQLRELKTEQVLGQSVSEDIRQVEKEIANSKLTYDFVCGKPIPLDDFILLKQTGEYYSMLEEFERAVNELKSNEVNQVQRLCKQVDHMKKSVDKEVTKETKSVVSHNNENQSAGKS